MNFSLDQLIAFEAICRLGSFAVAAKEIHRATSAVSYSIKNLENALKVKLFDRSGHRATLTTEGELILNKVHEVLEGYDTWSNLNEVEEFALYHPKDIERQVKQNNYYDTL